ncbi:MAG: hypothetical protein MZV64_60475 [Ignavibacteriales bacterium]|nr:hypothetical protein [Ignavibacteriales bacterium]
MPPVSPKHAGWRAHELQESISLSAIIMNCNGGGDGTGAARRVRGGNFDE